MALELTSLVFKTETSDLERASKVIGELVTNVGKLDKAARDAAQTEVVLAKAAKLNADANLQNAKAQDVRLKSTITADKADQQAAAAIERKTKATEKATESSAKNVGVLQRQKDILEFQTQGFSRGQSSILSYAKAAGLAAEDIGELGKVLETQRKLMGGDPFDKSLSGLKSLRNQYTELKESIRQYAADSNLTAKQTRELARDKERLIEKMKVEGASFSEIRQAVRAANVEYVKLAEKYNKAVSTEAEVIKSRKEAVNATNYLTQADQKMAAALNTSNAALDKAGTDSLVKYEAALRKSGISQDAATAKLATYKAQLTQVAGLEEKRRAQHLARALQPQFTDIAVSLYSGQAPLTVLLQQSGQMVDLFKLSGIEAANLGKVMREAFASMIPAIATVAKGLTSLVFESFMSAGSAVTRFVGDVTGITAAMEIFKRFIVSGGEANFKYIASLDKIGKTFSAVAATGIAAMIAGMILLGLEYKKIVQAEGELSKALATSGGAIGISKDQAVAYAESMQAVGVGTLKAMNAITEFTKAGKIGKEGLDGLIKSAINLERYAGVPIEETAKKFAKLQDEPTKALIEFTEANGQVSKSVLDVVASLEQQGDKSKAVEAATRAMEAANNSMAEEAKANLSPIETLWNDIKSAIGSVKQEIYDLATSNAVVGALRTVWETVAVVISEVWFTIKGVGKEIGGIGAQIAAVMQGDFSGAAEIGRQMKADAASAAEEQKKYVDAILNRTSAEQKSFNQSKEQNSQYAKWRKENDQALDKSISKTDKYKAKELEMQKAVLAGTVSQIEADKALAGWKKIIFGEEKTKKDPSENYYATLMREATASSIKAEDATKSLTASQVKLLEAVNDPRFLKLSKVQQETYLSTMAANVATEQQTALTEKLADAEEHRLKLLGKSEGIGKQYYSDMQKLEEFAKVAGWSREEIEELTRAVFKSTPAWKAYEKALEDVNTASRKFQEDSLASQASTMKENESLDYRLSLLGKTAEEQKALSIEYNRANKLSEVRIKLAKQLRDIEVDIEKAKKAGLPEEKYKNLIDAQVQARKDAAEQEKVINREVAVQYAEDLQKEFDAIKNGISDSIVTALFEGGKAGSKKLRDVLENTLRKRVTMVVDVAVNAVLNNVVGGLLGGGSAGATAAGGVGLLGTLGNAGGLIGNVATGLQGTTGVLGSIGTFLGTNTVATNAGIAASLGIDAVSANAAAVGANAAGGGFLSSIGSAMPWIAGAAALYSIISSFDDSGTYHTGGASRYSKSGGLTSGNSGAAFDIGFGQVETGKETISAMETLSKSLVEIFDGIAKTFGKTAGYEVAVAFADDTSKDGAWGAFAVRLQGVEILNWDDFRQSKWAPKEFGDGEEGYKQYLAAVAKDTRQVLLNMDLPSWADTMLESIGDAANMEQLSATVQQIGAIQTMFVQLGKTVEGFAGMGDKAFEELMAASGGADALAKNVGSFYESYYSEAERMAKSTELLGKEFAALGVEMPATKDAFRGMVEDLLSSASFGAQKTSDILGAAMGMFNKIGKGGSLKDAARSMLDAFADTGESGMELAAKLLQLAPAFAQVSDYAYAANEALRASLIGLESSFAGGGFSRQYRAEDAAQEISGLFSGIGIQKDVGMLTQQILNATGGEVEQFFRDLWPALKTDEARQKLVDVTSELLNLANGAGSVADAYQKQSDNLSKLATEVSSLFAARNSAGSLLDKIAGAMGNKGSFAAQREGELWNALGSTSDYKKKVELASQLTDIVLQRQQLEVQNAERLLNFGQGLRDYVNGLKLSDLSPLTNAEKLAEASKQYSETLSKAIGGDTNAQSSLQAVSSSYLELARTYYAGNEQFSNIFNSVTSSLDTLGINSMTESQQQIAIGNQSLEELQKLYGITETAYEALNKQYENSLYQLIAAQDALVLQASSLEQLVSISNLLTNLPTEIAVRLPTVDTALNPLHLRNSGATSGSSNAELLEELKLLRIQVEKLEASNREDARMQADVFVVSSQATAYSIASATTKAARAAELKQGAIIK